MWRCAACHGLFKFRRGREPPSTISLEELEEALSGRMSGAPIFRVVDGAGTVTSCCAAAHAPPSTSALARRKSAK
eukprot:117132-Chlamydomonas_euryale.AAC.5